MLENTTVRKLHLIPSSDKRTEERFGTLGKNYFQSLDLLMSKVRSFLGTTSEHY
jgi:hypothetical protein